MAKRRAKTLEERVQESDSLPLGSTVDEDTDAEETKMGEDAESADAPKPVNKITLKAAPKEVLEILSGVLEKHFKDLDEAGVKIGVIMADAGLDGQDKPIPAVKVKGVPQNGITKVNAVVNRVIKGPDAILKIDMGVWRTMSEKARKSLMHRLCMHLQIQTDGDGAIKKDDANRPILKYRQPDYIISGFAENIRIFGDQSVDVVDWTKFHNAHGQGLMPFMAQG